MRKYILNDTIVFDREISPDTQRYYDMLKHVNEIRIKKEILKRRKAGNLNIKLPKPPSNPKIDPFIIVLLIGAIWFFLVNLVEFLKRLSL